MEEWGVEVVGRRKGKPLSRFFPRVDFDNEDVRVSLRLGLSRIYELVRHVGHFRESSTKVNVSIFVTQRVTGS